MKALRRFLIFISMIALMLTLVSCTENKCTEHKDDDKNEICDKCGETVAVDGEGLLLLDDGIPTFQFVIERSLDRDTRKLLDAFASALDSIGVELDIVIGKSDNEIECEILIGDVPHRGSEYFFDKHTLGPQGYIIKTVGKKIIINGGSTEALDTAVNKFVTDILGYSAERSDYGTLYFAPSQELHVIQSEYEVTAIKVGGTEINEYTISTDTDNQIHLEAAKVLQAGIYERAGYWLDIVGLDKAERSIIIRSAEPVWGDESFKAYTNDKNQLIMDCSFENKLISAVSNFTDSKLSSAKGNIDFSGNVFKKDISFLTYEEFGAKGDGETDDFEALDATHREANKYGQTVRAKDDATYYIKNSYRVLDEGYATTPIIVKTSTNWGNANFTIDDRELKIISGSAVQALNHIFSIESDYDVITIDDEETLTKVLAAGLNPDTTNIPLKFDYPVMIIPSDDTHSVYRRVGYSASQGSQMHEVILLDKDGNVDPDTPIMFNYTALKQISVYRLDIKPITIEGGVFTTRASQDNALVGTEDRSIYVRRGIDCRRSFTTIKGVKHYVTDEVRIFEQVKNGRVVHVSAPYIGFFVTSNATDVTYEDCILTGRRCYTRPVGGTGGTYDLSGANANNITFKNCHQHNFWITMNPNTKIIEPAANRDVEDATTSMTYTTYGGVSLKVHWGIGGVNFCKNLSYIDSTLSRFDAHEGLYNGKIIRSTVNYMSLTGNGDFIVEDSVWYSEATGANSASIFHLRADYGSTWDGDIKVKNLDAYVHTGGRTYLFLHSYTNWYFGYIAHMPNLSLDNLNVYNIATYEPVMTQYPIYMMQSSVANEPKMHLENTAGSPGRYCYIDLDKDGFVDGTEGTIEFDENLASSRPSGVTLNSSNPNYYKNLNVIAPPKHLKIINNDGVDANGDGTPDGGYKFIVPDTTGKGIPAADDLTGLEPDVDPQGGFFATTKFWYSATEYCRVGDSDNNTFFFE